jgi:HD-GYP domain-containing protein (c-di-GMP phosphodiesterase class II)
MAGGPSSKPLPTSSPVVGSASRAATLSGLAADQATLIRRSALVHDLGCAAIPNTIWERIGPLGPMGQAQEQLHPYYSERIPAPIAAFRQIGAVASLHHERLDGTGYHRQLRADGLSPVARLLAAADAWACA